ncbi:hypothetical protein [uncultured Campylobacter sp.]|uniref:hypothetical protein n=2 Tax=uncultured Campylobacter sp. TaxID=218934 RepID=UPI0026146642|nr:hypothetical protein [uncultured Campylobacter sp.]
MLKVFRTTFIKILLFSSLFASDPITFDSLFKKQLGLRMVTSFEYLSSGNADFYNTYPYISTYNDGKNYLDNRQFSLRQSFIYSINDSLDIITNARLSYTQSDTQEGGFFTPIVYKTEQRTNFDNLSLGFIYSFASIGSFIPQFSAQASIFDRVRFTTSAKMFYAKSINAQFSLKTYSDPIVLSIYFGGGYNDNLKFKSNTVKFGNAIFAGIDSSIILSPKISLDIGFSQTYQSSSKFNGVKYTSNYSIPNTSLGFSYSFDNDSAVAVSSSISGSSSAPSSIFALSYWKKI